MASSKLHILTYAVQSEIFQPSNRNHLIPTSNDERAEHLAPLKVTLMDLGA